VEERKRGGEVEGEPMRAHLFNTIPFHLLNTAPPPPQEKTKKNQFCQS